MMVFIGFNGLPRTGKTLAVTIFTVLLRSMVTLGNFPISVAGFREITPYDLVKLLGKGRVPFPVTVALQEVYAWLDSQRLMKVDSSLREMTPYRFLCAKKRWGFEYQFLNPAYTDRNVPVRGRVLRVPFGVAERFYGLYNTYKGALPVGYEELATEMQRLVPEVMFETVQRQVGLLLGKRVEYGFLGVKGVSVPAVKYALMCEREPVCFADMVCQGLRLCLFKKKGS